MKSFPPEVNIFIFWLKTMDYSPWFDFWESEKSLEIRMPSERASQGEQNGAFSALQRHAVSSVLMCSDPAAGCLCAAG